MNQNIKILLYSSIAFLAIMIGGAIFILLGGASSLFSLPPAGLEMQLNIPENIAKGENYQISVSLVNTGNNTLTIDEIHLPQTLLDASILLEATPADKVRRSYGEYTSFEYGNTLAPGEKQDYHFLLQNQSAGKFSGAVEVVANDRKKTGAIQLTATDSAAIIKNSTISPVGNTIPYESAVQITAYYKENNRLVEGWTGSGSIITSDGLVLTNAHVVLPDKDYPVDAILVSVTTSQDKPPTPSFYAEVVQADAGLDIAVIRPTTDLDGKTVNRAKLNLPAVSIGDSDQLQLGDQINIIGYPGIGGETITLTQGVVSGFTSESGAGDRAFIKTSATISGGNSGGLVSNTKGQLIGIPTQLGYGGTDQYVDCRVLADTNRDGTIDNNDACVPTGGFINALRPVKLALPLIQAAKEGIVNIVYGTQNYSQTPPPQGGEILFQDDFSNALNRWSNWNDTDGSVGYQNGTYQISVSSPKTYIWGRPGQTFSASIITVQASVLNPTGQGDYGIVCRFRDDGNFSNFYAFEVSEDGFYSIWKYENGKVVSLKDWTSASQLNNLSPSMTLQASCVGSTLTLSVNNITIDQVSDNSFSSGDTGLIAGTMDKGGLLISFDNFIVQKPAQNQ
jgi:S1-C subfamily serine protease